MFGSAQLLFVVVVVLCARGSGKRAPAQAWGEFADDLEWTVPSPAPLHTFETPPDYQRPAH